MGLNTELGQQSKYHFPPTETGTYVMVKSDRADRRQVKNDEVRRRTFWPLSLRKALMSCILYNPALLEVVLFLLLFLICTILDCAVTNTWAAKSRWSPVIKRKTRHSQILAWLKKFIVFREKIVGVYRYSWRKLYENLSGENRITIGILSPTLIYRYYVITHYLAYQGPI